MKILELTESMFALEPALQGLVKKAETQFGLHGCVIKFVSLEPILGEEQQSTMRSFGLKVMLVHDRKAVELKGTLNFSKAEPWLPWSESYFNGYLCAPQADQPPCEFELDQRRPEPKEA